MGYKELIEADKKHLCSLEPKLISAYQRSLGIKLFSEEMYGAQKNLSGLTGENQRLLRAHEAHKKHQQNK